MQLFERNVEVDRLASAVEDARATEPTAHGLVTLAWYLRQRDNARATDLASRAREALAAQAADTGASLAARLTLVDAETAWLRSDLEHALPLAQGALQTFQALADPIGCADAEGLLAFIHSSAGNLPLRDASLVAAVHHARLGQDAQRVDYLEANQARFAALSDVRQSLLQWGERFAMPEDDATPCVAASVHAFFATRDYNSGNLAGALEQFDRAFATAHASGQLVTAVVAAVNAGSAYSALNDHDAALEWLQRGLDLARPNGWPMALGPCLRQMGEVMRVMGRLDTAQSLLDEALQVFAPLRQSRSFNLLLSGLGDLAQTRGDYARALSLFREQAERAQHMAQIDRAIEGHIGIAHALLQLGDDENAGYEAQLALQLSRQQGTTVLEVSALRLLARVHAHRGDRSRALERLEQALTTARGIGGYLVPGELLFALAEEYALHGRHADAYQMAVQAAEARERVLSQEATNRATAMQIRLDTERSHAQMEHHRRQAEAEARRAAVLQQSSDTLARLGTIGQEITSQLDKEHVFQAIERHVHGLLDASSFAIYLMDPDGRSLTSVYDIEEGVRLPGDRVSIDDSHSYSARCVRERRELLVDFADAATAPNYVPGTLVTLSALFAPLAIADRVLGVMTIQSTRAQAYAENERLIFRTLCAYTAIALDNAVAYTHLRDAKDQLVVQEKLAALGALVAGVAHELNTPIGNSLLTASTLQENTAALETAVAGGTLRRSTLADYMASTQEGLELVIRGLRAAGELVQSFKQVAVDRATEQRRHFDLLRTSLEVVATLQRGIQKAGHRIAVDIEPGIVLDSYPGPYGQVLTNLINNALLHAFDGRKGGTMRLQAQRLGPALTEIRFSDDGVGIAPENLARIFDPFFTTKLGRGGSGLGMSISYNIVTSLFGGELVVDSALGQGTCFTLRLPLQAPEHATPDPYAPGAEPPAI